MMDAMPAPLESRTDKGGAVLAALRDAAWLDAPRVRRLCAALLIAALAILAADVFAHTRVAGLADARGEVLGRDLINFWAGARLAAHGDAVAAYDIPGYLAYIRGLTVPNAEFKWYGYPPLGMLLTAPIGVLPYLAAWALWTAAGVALVALPMRASIGWTWALVAALAAPASVVNIISGQNGAFTAALLAGGVACLPRRPWLAGMLFGLLFYKPHLGLMIPVALLAARQWRAIAAAAATIAVLLLASGLYAGWDAWAAFLRIAPMNGELLTQSRGMWPRIPSVYLALRWLGADNTAGMIGQGLAALAVAVGLFKVWASPTPQPIKGAALMIAAFLATPYAWDYDMVTLTVAAVWFWSQASADGWRPWEKLSLAAMLALPLFAAIGAFYAHIQLGPPVLAAMFVLTVRRALSPQSGGVSLSA